MFNIPAGVTISTGQTQPTRPGKASRPVWTVAAPPAFDEALRAAGGCRFRGAWSFFEDPTEQLQALARQSFAERQELARERAGARADRRDGYAANATARADAARASVQAIASHIPFGQPILVGHHSEGRARRDAARMDAGMRKAIEEGQAAERHARLAEVARGKAVGAHSLTYMAAKVDEAEVQLRDVARKLAGSQGPVTEDWRARLEALQAEQQERADYWRGLIAEAGGIPFSRENVKKGDRLKYRGIWYPVARANAKSVTVSGWLGVATMTWTVPYAEVQDVQQTIAS